MGWTTWTLVKRRRIGRITASALYAPSLSATLCTSGEQEAHKWHLVFHRSLPSDGYEGGVPTHRGDGHILK